MLRDDRRLIEHRAALEAWRAKGEVEQKAWFAGRLAALMPPLAVQGVADGSSGYGQMTAALCRALESEGIPVRFSPLFFNEGYRPLDPFLKGRIVHRKPRGPILAMAGPAHRIPSGSILLTMYETTTLWPRAVKNLNRARCVIVPCRDNARWFAGSGVTAPIRVVPLGIDPNIYHPTISEPADVFRVGVAGRVGLQGDRKRLGLMARLFVAAFPDEADVRLEIKCFAGCRPEGVPDDPRIAIVRESLADEGLADWYRSLSVFASASLGEGWGLQPHQAMAVGRPTIAAFWGGHRDYMTDCTSWPVEYREPHHCEVDGASMVARLREAYADREGRLAKGPAAAKRAAEFTWSRSGRELAAVVREFGLWGPATASPARREFDREEYERIRLLILGCDYRGPKALCGCTSTRICLAGKGKAVPGTLLHDVTDQECRACVSA